MVSTFIVTALTSVSVAPASPWTVEVGVSAVNAMVEPTSTLATVESIEVSPGTAKGHRGHTENRSGGGSGGERPELDPTRRGAEVGVAPWVLKRPRLEVMLGSLERDEYYLSPR